MDGNGRWAQARGLPRNAGHQAGVENVERIVEAARHLNVRYLTLYAFSVENWKRPKAEVEALMFLLERFLKRQRAQLLKQQIRFRVLGQIDAMPPKVAKLLRETIALTADFDQWNLSLCLNYGARTEIVDAMQAWGTAVAEGREDPRQLGWDKLASYLYTGDIPDPDLVIRTSGEFRISNFLLLQSAYAEYYFTALQWPDFGPEAFEESIVEYGRRERRFGLTGEQIKATATNPALSTTP